MHLNQQHAQTGITPPAESDILFELEADHIKTAMEVAVWSEKQFEIATEHKFSRLIMALLSRCLLNCDARSGQIHPFKPKDLAKELECEEGTVREIVKKVNASGIATFTLKNRKITGKLHYMAMQELKKDQQEIDFLEDPDRLKTAMMHKTDVARLIVNKSSGAQWRTAVALAFHCYHRTGELDEKTVATFSDIVGIYRTSLKRALDHLNAIGYLQTEIDYVVHGKIRTIGLAAAYFEVKKTEQGYKDKGWIETAKMTVSRAKNFLYQAYGIPLEFLTNTSRIKKAFLVLDPLKQFKPDPTLEKNRTYTKKIGTYTKEFGAYPAPEPA